MVSISIPSLAGLLVDVFGVFGVSVIWPAFTNALPCLPFSTPAVSHPSASPVGNTGGAASFMTVSLLLLLTTSCKGSLIRHLQEGKMTWKKGGKMENRQ
jgi:hypothetical protein